MRSPVGVIRCMVSGLLAITAFAALVPRPGESDRLTLGNGSVNFLVLSDWGREGINDTTKKAPGQLKVARQLGATAGEIGASFVVTCGDNFHGRGVSSPTDQLWEVNYERVYRDRSLQIPWFVALGNHDYEGNVNAELQYARTSGRWVQPARYYAFTRELPDSTAILFLVLDSSPFVREYRRDPRDHHHVLGQDTAAQVRWLDSTLSQTRAHWKLAFFHHPVYSASTTHGSTIELQGAFRPLFECYHVDACFSGHDHDMQHSRPEGSTVEYFGVGGGSETRPAGHSPFTKFSVASLGFGVVSVTRHELRVSFVNDRGEQIYCYDLRK